MECDFDSFPNRFELIGNDFRNFEVLQSVGGIFKTIEGASQGVIIYTERHSWRVYKCLENFLKKMENKGGSMETK